MDRKIKKYTKNKTIYINKLLDFNKKYKIIFDKTDYLSIFLDDKKILAGEYNFYGIFQKNTKLWIWASSIPGVPIRHIKNIRKIKKNNHLFENNNNIKYNFYYQLLSQDVLLITDDKMLIWINELLLYLSNGIYYFNPINSDKNIQFLILQNIKEKYI